VASQKDNDQHPNLHPAMTTQQQCVSLLSFYTFTWDSQSPAIFIMEILKGQTENLCTQTVVWTVAHLLKLTAISTGFEAEVFTGWMPFLSCNQLHQGSEGKATFQTW